LTHRDSMILGVCCQFPIVISSARRSSRS
jgi:hypothetical protein